MRILIINASHRNGNTDQIVKKVKNMLKKHAVKELILRNIEMKMPDGCQQCAEGEHCPNICDDFSVKIEPTLRNFDIYILATPTWSDNVTPLTLIFWNRIVSWCHEDKQYLKGKKLAVITHGMADSNSWTNVVNWVKGVCVWERALYGGSFTCKTGGRVGVIDINQEKLDEFIKQLIEPQKI